MKKALMTLVIAMAVVTTGAVAKDWKKVRIGVEGAYPPFSFVDADGNLGGFDIEIANALCEEMKVECKLVPQDWDGIIPALLARKYDAILASMSITEERKKKVAFTKKYYHTPAKFAGKKGMFTDISPASLKGKKVGVQRATTHDRYLTDNYGDDVEIKRYGTFDESILDLVAGRLDLILADSVNVTDGFLKKDQGKGFELVGPSLTDERWFGEGAGIAIRKKDTELVEKFNTAIAAIRANGKYKTINDKYFEFDVYGE